MKIESFVFGSMMVAVLGGAAGCGGSDGTASADTSTDALRSGKTTVSLAAFKASMEETAQWADNDPCSFSLTSKDGDLDITVTADNSTASISVSHRDTITLSDKSFGDGSIETYKIAGVGTVTVTNASDAYESVEIKPERGASATCEIDF